MYLPPSTYRIAVVLYLTKLPCREKKENIDTNSMASSYGRVDATNEGASERMYVERVVEDDKLYIVEEILSHRTSEIINEQGEAEIEFLIKWKGFPHSSNTWEPASNCSNCEKKVEEYWERQERIELFLEGTRPNVSSPQHSHEQKCDNAQHRHEQDDNDPMENSKRESEEFLVERILDHRVDRLYNTHGEQQLEFLIKWQGYPESSNTWEPASNCTNCDLKVAAYWDRKRKQEYLVEAILDHRYLDTGEGKELQLQFLVKWQGYPHSSNTWETESNCKNCTRLVSISFL